MRRAIVISVICISLWLPYLLSLVPAFVEVSVDRLFDNFEAAEKKICFGKSLGKIVNFASVSLNIRTREKQN